MHQPSPCPYGHVAVTVGTTCNAESATAPAPAQFQTLRELPLAQLHLWPENPRSIRPEQPDDVEQEMPPEAEMRPVRLLLELGRRCFALELDARYPDITWHRYQELPLDV